MRQPSNQFALEVPKYLFLKFQIFVQIDWTVLYTPLQEWSILF